MLEDEYNLIKNVTQKSRNSSLISSSKKSKSRKNNIHKGMELWFESITSLMVDINKLLSLGARPFIPNEIIIVQYDQVFYFISDQEMVKRKKTSKVQTDGVVINHRSGSSDTSDDSDSKKHSSGHNSGK